MATKNAEKNKKCYTIKKQYYTSGLFDNSIDCTYVILCCGTNPHREKQCIMQLDKFKPTKLVKLIYNKGFKNCNKELEKQSTEYDLRDALMFVFKDASHIHNNVLVLEDDFEVNMDIISQTHHINTINNFLLSYEPDVYGLGNICLINPMYLFSEHQKSMFMFISHAIIYSKSYRKAKLLKYSEKYRILPRHIDMHWNNATDVVYRYHKQLVYQKHDITENMKNWPVPLWFSKIFIKLLRLKTNSQNGYDNLNSLNYIVSIGFVIGMLCIFQIIWEKKYNYII